MWLGADKVCTACRRLPALGRTLIASALLSLLSAARIIAVSPLCSSSASAEVVTMKEVAFPKGTEEDALYFIKSSCIPSEQLHTLIYLVLAPRRGYCLEKPNMFRSLFFSWNCKTHLLQILYTLIFCYKGYAHHYTYFFLLLPMVIFKRLTFLALCTCI